MIKKIRDLIAIFACVAVIGFVFYAYFDPTPFGYEHKSRQALESSISYLMTKASERMGMTDEERRHYSVNPDQFISDYPDCCEAWVVYRGVAPNDDLSERSLDNAWYKLDTLLNIESYYVRITVSADRKLYSMDFAVSAGGRIQDYFPMVRERPL